MIVPADKQPLLLPDVAVELTRLNPPGQQELDYRGGLYTASLQRSLARLPRLDVDGDSAGALAPLGRINVQADDDWTIALLHAWAAVSEVLSFYQERIVNEGYLRTARRPLSLAQLARAVGYTPRPGLAATTYLALAVQHVVTEPPRHVLVPRGTPVQSVPAPGRGGGGPPPAVLPQVFETSADLLARAEWNLLRPGASGEQAWARHLAPGTTALRLLGHRTDLRKGDPLLILGEPLPGGSERPWRLVRLVAVTPDLARGLTWIEWQDDPARPPTDQILAQPRLFLLRQQAALFGYTPTGLYLLHGSAPSQGGENAAPEEDRPAPSGLPPDPPTWRPAGIGLPPVPVRALLRTRAGHLLAATGKDVFRSSDGGRAWQPASTGIVTKHVTALAENPDGTLYAGTDDGRVFETRDGGEVWRATTPDTTLAPIRGIKKRWPAGFDLPLPRTAIRSLQAYRRGRRSYLAAGTDDGVFVSANGGETWQPANLNLPHVDRTTGRSKDVAWSLLPVMKGKGDRARSLLAGTDAGVLPAGRPPSLWPLLLLSLILVGGQRLLLSATTPLVAWLLGLVPGALTFLQGVPDWFDDPRIPQSVLDAVTKAFKPITDQTLPQDWPGANLSQLNLPGNAGQAFSSPLVLFAVDVILVLALLVAVVAAWGLLRRAVYNRPGRRIGGEPVPALPLALTKLLAGLPFGPALAARLTKPGRVPVYALAVNGAGQLVAGTGQGIYLAARAAGRASLGWRILDLLGGLLFPGPNRHWRRVHDGLAARSLHLAADGHTLLAGGQPLAGGAPGEVWRSTDGGQTWQPVAGGLALAGVSAVVDGRPGWLAAGTPPGGKVEPRWSPFHLDDRSVHLDAVYPGIEPSSWLVLAEAGSPAPPPRLVQVQAAVGSESRDFARAGAFTRLTVDSAAGLVALDRSRCAVLAHSQPLDLYDDEPVWGSRVRLDRFVPGLAAGQRILVSGKRMRVSLAAPAADVVRLATADGLLSVPIRPGVSYQLLAPPPPAAEGTPGQRLNLRDREGLAGLAEVGDARFVLEPAAGQDEEVSELAVIGAVENGPDFTCLTLEWPLSNVYERPTVTMRANVVGASHGKTVRDEVLGSSDGSQANQRFRLRQGPLTYVSQPGAEGLDGQLAVSVTGVVWHEVPFLYGRQRDERVYEIHHDHRGRTSITFGDGRAGARLPSTREEVRATYRIGSGEAGNVAAHSLTQLMFGPPGIDSVTNPLPASGGVDPEPADSTRENAPLSLRAMHRIVSLSDYEDFCRTFAGIGQVQARSLHIDRETLLHITVAGGDGQPLPPDSDLYRNLVAAIERGRAAPVPRVQVDSYEPVYFDLTLTLVIHADHRPRQAAIEAQARQVLRRALGQAGRALAGEVSAAGIVSLVQPLPGVVAVEITRLALAGGAGVTDRLPAHPARWDAAGGQVRPAQLLLVNPYESGILIRLELAP